MPPTQTPLTPPPTLDTSNVHIPRERLSSPSSKADAVIAERVRQALNVAPYASLRGMDVLVVEGLVILSGNVPTWHLKQIAQATVMSVPGVEAIRNGLAVVRPG